MVSKPGGVLDHPLKKNSTTTENITNTTEVNKRTGYNDSSVFYSDNNNTQQQTSGNNNFQLTDFARSMDRLATTFINNSERYIKNNNDNITRILKQNSSQPNKSVVLELRK